VDPERAAQPAALSGWLGIDLDKDLIGSNHAQVVAGTFFDGLLTLDQITYLTFELLIAFPQGSVDRMLLLDLMFELTDFEYAPSAPPERVLHHKEQAEQDQRKPAHGLPGIGLSQRKL
jgi:hypothetical protein